VIQPQEFETVVGCPLCGHGRSRPWRQAACIEAPDEVFAIVECEACTLRYLNPRPRPQALGRYYAADYYSYQPSEVRPRSHVLKCGLWRCLGLLPPRLRPGVVAGAVRTLVRTLVGVRSRWLLPASEPDARFLDIGCGAGYRLDLAQELGWETCGVDLGVGGLPVAREHGHRVAAGDAVILPFADGSFDYVNLAHTLEHTRDPVAVLAECGRVLAAEGVVQIVVPNSASWGSRRYGNHWRALDVPRHLLHFTARSLRAVAERAGLRAVAVSTLDDAWVLQESAKLAGETEPPAPGALSRRLLRRRGYGENLNMWCTRA